MRKFLVALVLVLAPNFLEAQTTLSCGVPGDSFTNAAIVDSTFGTSYALYSNLLYVTWQTSFGVAPGAISVSLQGSLDNLAWSTIDTSTSTSGDIRNVAGSYRFIRAYVNSHTGGSGMTVTLNCTRQSGSGSGSGYSQVEEEGSALTKRTVLNFEGAGSTCVDDTTKTTCTITSGGGGAPVDAQYVVSTADPTLSAERVCTDTATIDCDAGTAAQMKFNLFTNPNLDWTGAHSFLDASFSLKDNTTPTKILKFELSGLTATTRTYTAPDLDGTIIALDANGFGVRTAAGTVASRSIAAGTGISVANGNGVSGNPTVSYDSATTPQFSSGTGDVPATGGLATQYFETDVPGMYVYPAIDTEHWVLSIAAGQTAGRLFQTSATDALTEITPTDETVLVSNGTTWEKKTLPDCDDTGGQHLNYNTSDNTFSCGTSGDGGASTFDPTTITLYEEFDQGDGYSDYFGEKHFGRSGLTSALINTGSGEEGASSGVTIGTVRLNSHATNDNSGLALYLQLVGHQLWMSEEWSLDARVIPGANGTAITDTGLYFGLTYNPTSIDGTPHAIWIRRDTDRTDTAYIFQVCDSATNGCQANGDDTNSNTVASTITPVAGTANRLRIRRVASGVGGNPTIYMRVDTETEKTFCSSGCDETLANIPSDNIAPFVTYITRTTTGVKSAEVDYVYLSISGLAR